MPEPEFDVAIHGAGPVGCALALALRGSGLRVALAGRKRGLAQAPAAVRPIALSYASRLILERMHAWASLSTTPIERIHVGQAGGFGRTEIACDELGLPALGYVAGYDDIATSLANSVDPASWFADEAAPPQARLAVHAEGSVGTDAIEKDYRRTAIAALVESERPPRGIAFERFTREGPLALLPLGGAYGLVWSRTAAAAAASMAAGDARFLAELQAAFGMRAGRFCSVGMRASTPLALRYRASRATAGEVRIGNAAQTLHPVAGQGLNLGLRDAWDLNLLLRNAPAESIGSTAFAERFMRKRRRDSQATIRATDFLATFFLRPDPVSVALRGAALTALDIFPPARKLFARRMIFGASAW